MTDTIKPPLPEPAAHAVGWHARGGEDIGWLDFYAQDDKVPSDWDGPPPDEVQALYTAEQMHAYADAAVAQERLRIARALALMHAESASSHNYYGHLCLLMKEGKL